MQIAITGGSGFVGTHAGRFFLDRGHSVVAIGRRGRHALEGHPRFRYLSADTTTAGAWQSAVNKSTGVLNLAGQSIMGRWTTAYKEKLRNSRIATTRHIVDALSTDTPTVLISASAVGFYGDGGETRLTESAAGGHDFLAQLSRDWESTADLARSNGHRVAIARLGIVLAQDGGALAKMLPVFKSWMGGALGNGRQWFPWIHLEDLLRALSFLMEDPNADGLFNCTSPEPVRNIDFAKALGRVLKRPVFIRTPALAIKTVLGEMGDSLLVSQRAIPEALVKAGFRFRHARIEKALQDLLRTP